MADEPHTHPPEFDQIIGIIYFHLFYRENFDDIYNSRVSVRLVTIIGIVVAIKLCLGGCHAIAHTMVHVVFDEVTVQRQDNRANGVFAGV